MWINNQVNKSFIHYSFYKSRKGTELFKFYKMLNESLMESGMEFSNFLNIQLFVFFNTDLYKKKRIKTFITKGVSRRKAYCSSIPLFYKNEIINMANYNGLSKTQIINHIFFSTLNFFKQWN